MGVECTSIGGRILRGPESLCRAKGANLRRAFPETQPSQDAGSANEPGAEACLGPPCVKCCLWAASFGPLMEKAGTAEAKLGPRARRQRRGKHLCGSRTRSWAETFSPSPSRRRRSSRPMSFCVVSLRLATRRTQMRVAQGRAPYRGHLRSLLEPQDRRGRKRVCGGQRRQGCVLRL